MAKRKNGEGTWGTKKIRGIQYKFYRNPDGKYFYGKTEKEIREKIRKYTPSQDQFKDIKKESFGDYVLKWLLDLKKTEVKRRTIDGYEDCIRGELINYEYHDLSDTQVGSLTADDFTKYYSSLAEHYSKATIKKNYAILSQCIKYGNKRQHFSAPIDLEDIKLPHEDNVANKKKEIRFLSSDDMEKLYVESQRINVPGFNFGGKIGESTYGNNANLLMFMMFTGIRIGEAIDLQWKDIDLSGETPKVHVRSNSSRVKSRNGGDEKYETVSTTTKTRSGFRSIPLNKQALEIINKEENLNPKHTPDDYVFITKSGKKIKSRQNVNRTLKNMMLRAGCSIPTCTPHELRHSFGSALIKKGVDIKVVSKLLGHKDVTITYNIYIHILEEQEIEAVKSLDVL